MTDNHGLSLPSSEDDQDLGAKLPPGFAYGADGKVCAAAKKTRAVGYTNNPALLKPSTAAPGVSLEWTRTLDTDGTKKESKPAFSFGKRTTDAQTSTTATTSSPPVSVTAFTWKDRKTDGESQASASQACVGCSCGKHYVVEKAAFDKLLGK